MLDGGVVGIASDLTAATGWRVVMFVALRLFVGLAQSDEAWRDICMHRFQLMKCTHTKLIPRTVSNLWGYLKLEVDAEGRAGSLTDKVSQS